MNEREGVILSGVKTTKLLLEIKKQIDWLNQFETVYIPIEYFEELISDFSVEIFKLGVEVGKGKRSKRGVNIEESQSPKRETGFLHYIYSYSFIFRSTTRALLTPTNAPLLIWNAFDAIICSIASLTAAGSIGSFLLSTVSFVLLPRSVTIIALTALVISLQLLNCILQSLFHSVWKYPS